MNFEKLIPKKYVRIAKLVERTRLTENKTGFKLIDDAFSYVFQSPGKRVRPLLAFFVCEAYGGSPRKAIKLGAAIEMLHEGTLIIDDVIDHAHLRRGMPTLFSRYGEDSSVLLGNLMIVKSYGYLQQTLNGCTANGGSLLNRLLDDLCAGQIMDCSFSENTDIDIDIYLDMISKKCGSLIGASMQFGALISNVSEEEAERIYSLGERIGTAYQVLDDYLDVFGSEEKMGKPVGADLKNKKYNLIYILLMKKMEEKNLKVKMNDMSIYNYRDLVVDYNIDFEIKKILDDILEDAKSRLDNLYLDEEYKNGFKHAVLESIGIDLIA